MSVTERKIRTKYRSGPQLTVCYVWCSFTAPLWISAESRWAFALESSQLSVCCWRDERCLEESRGGLLSKEG